MRLNVIGRDGFRSLHGPEEGSLKLYFIDTTYTGPRDSPGAQSILFHQEKSMHLV